MKMPEGFCPGLKQMTGERLSQRPVPFCFMTYRVKVLSTVFLLLVLGAYIAYRLATNPEWQQFHADRFWQTLVQVRVSYVLLAALMIFASYFFRSLRWRTFLLPMKKGRLDNIFVSTLIGFSAVALMGRPGEFVRPYLIARKEKLGISSQLAAWTLERIFDALVMCVLLGAGLLLLSPDSDFFKNGSQAMVRLRVGGIFLGAVSVLVAILLMLLRSNAKATIGFLLRCAWMLPERHRERLEKLLMNFSGGLGSIGSVSSFMAVAGYSLLVWVPVVLTYWGVTRAFGWPMTQLDLGAVLLLLAITVVGSLLLIPGVGGGTQVATVVALTELFGIPLEVATSVAIVLWLLTYMIVLVPGLPLAAREGLTWQRLRSMAGAAT